MSFGSAEWGREMMNQELIVEISHRQTALLLDESQWVEHLETLLRAEGVQRGEVSVAIVDDQEMHELNRQYLDHDYPTDVLSFVLDKTPDWLLGEIIASADTAAACCQDFGWSASEELGLYLIHGALHLAGYDDTSPESRRVMREKELVYLRRFGLEPPVSEAALDHFGDALTGGAPSP